MAKLLKLRRGTTAQHTTTGGGFAGAEGEVTVDTDKDTVVVHDGSTVGGTPLATEALAAPKASPTFTGSHIGIPSVSTANRPGEGGGTNASVTATVGMVIYNTTLGMLQQYNATGWNSIDSPPIITSFTYPSGTTALDPAGVIVLTGSTTASGDATITHTTNSNLTPGMTVTGTGIPVDAVIITVTDSTHFELSADATATGSANVTLTINAQTLVITGTNFSLGATVLIDGTAPSIVTRNSATQITVTGTPAKSAATYSNGLVVSNTAGLSASVDIAYDALPAWTTAAGSLGKFLDDGGSGGSGAYTTADNIRIVAAEGSDTIDYAQTNSAGVVNTDGVAGLVLGTTGAGAGYLTGTLDGDESSTYNFYAKATDDEGQIGAVRLFNIISRGPYPTGGTIITSLAGRRIHVFLIGQTGTAFTPSENESVDWLVVAGGGGGGSGNGGAGGGGFRTGASHAVTAQAYTITVGAGGSSGMGNGGNSIFDTITSTGGGGGGNTSNAGNAGGSAGGGGYPSSAGGTATSITPITGEVTTVQGHDGGAGVHAPLYGGGGGGGAGAAGTDGSASYVGFGGIGEDEIMGLSAADSYALLTAASAGHDSGGARYFSGGGGGGKNAGTGGDAGLGGGGQGGAATGAGVAGTAGTGGGGGGGGTAGPGAGGVGGSGIVIISYAL